MAGDVMGREGTMLGVGVRGTSDQRGGRSGWPAGGGAKVDSVQVVMVLVRGRVDCCMEIASLLKPMARFLGISLDRRTFHARARITRNKFPQESAARCRVRCMSVGGSGRSS